MLIKETKMIHDWIKYKYVILFIIINYTVYYAGKHKHKWPS